MKNSYEILLSEVKRLQISRIHIIVDIAQILIYFFVGTFLSKNFQNDIGFLLGSFFSGGILIKLLLELRYKNRIESAIRISEGIDNGTRGDNV